MNFPLDKSHVCVGGGGVVMGHTLGAKWEQARRTIHFHAEQNQ